MRQTVPWTIEEINVVVRGRKDGLSSGAIAKLLPGRTRNSVMRQITNRGLVKMQPHFVRTIVKRNDPRFSCAPGREPEPELPAGSKPTPLVDVNDCQCRYPLWDTQGSGWPDFIVCGAETGTLPYCLTHRRLCRPKSATAQ